MAKRRRKNTEVRQQRRQAAFSGAVGAAAGSVAAVGYSRARGRPVKKGALIGAAATGAYLNARGGVNNVKRSQGKAVLTRKQRVIGSKGGRSRQRRDKHGRFA